MELSHILPVLPRSGARVEEHNLSSLLEMLGQMTDPRSPKGKRHQLVFVLAVTTVAVLAGARNFSEVGRRAADLPQGLLAALGAEWDYFTGGYLAPSESTIRRVLCDIDAGRLDMAIGAWLFEHAGRDAAGELVIALDGKVLRGAWTSENDQVTLFSAMVHREGLTIAQIRVPDGTNEITQVRALLGKVPLAPGMTIATLDAAHTQHETAAYLRGTRGIHYILTVKGNQPTLRKNVFDRCRPLIIGMPGHVEEERGHGRIRRWSTWVTDAKGINFPFAEQVAVIRREEFTLEGVRISKEYALIITSLPAGRAGPARIHTCVRQHWRIENKIHYVRDMTWQEDAGQAHTGNGPQSMAAIRNLAMGLFRIKGVNKIKEATERVAGDRVRALPFLAT
jgi:predicted transposase YbfD/YdcC